MKLVDRIGEALAAACMKEFGSTWSNDVRQRFALAALKSMREPTEGMVEAFAEAASDAQVAARAENRRLNRNEPNAIAECQWFPAAYKAMIEAEILQQKQ